MRLIRVLMAVTGFALLGMGCRAPVEEAGVMEVAQDVVAQVQDRTKGAPTAEDWNEALATLASRRSVVERVEISLADMLQVVVEGSRFSPVMMPRIERIQFMDKAGESVCHSVGTDEVEVGPCR